MELFLKTIVEGENLELIIDTNIFPKDIILKASYSFLNKAYFFFRFDEDKNIVLQLKKKKNLKGFPIEEILGDFSDELLSVYLRDKLEKDNKTIREKIIFTALSASLDEKNFVSFDTDKNPSSENNQIDFDKDIDEILKEIENDPDLKVSEAEIDKILKEIEAETALFEQNAPKITLDTNATQDAKKKFQDR